MSDGSWSGPRLQTHGTLTPFDQAITHPGCQLIRLNLARVPIAGYLARSIGATHTALVFDFVRINENASNTHQKHEARYTETTLFSVVVERNASDNGQAVDSLRLLLDALDDRSILYKAYISPCQPVDFEAYQSVPGKFRSLAARMTRPYFDMYDAIALGPDYWPVIDTLRFLKLLDIARGVVTEIQPRYDVRLWNCWWYAGSIMMLLDDINLGLSVRKDEIGSAGRGVLRKMSEGMGTPCQLSVDDRHGKCKWTKGTGLIDALRTWQAVSMGVRLVDARSMLYRFGFVTASVLKPGLAPVFLLSTHGSASLLGRVEAAAARNFVVELGRFDAELHRRFFSTYNQQGIVAELKLPERFDYHCTGWWTIPERFTAFSRQESLLLPELPHLDDLIGSGWDSPYVRRIQAIDKEIMRRKRILLQEGEGGLDRLEAAWKRARMLG